MHSDRFRSLGIPIAIAGIPIGLMMAIGIGRSE